MAQYALIVADDVKDIELYRGENMTEGKTELRNTDAKDVVRLRWRR
jgi:hypothetical protein